MTQTGSGPPGADQAGAETALLRRSTEDKVVGGVCGGLGRYFAVDPVWFRVAFVILAVGGGSGVLVYLIAWLIIPEEKPGDPVGKGPSSIGDHGPVIVGVVLIAIGLMLLANNLVPWFDKVMWPLAVVAAGLAFLYTGSRRERS